MSNYAKALGYEIYKIYKDEGKSAKNLNRPGVQRIIEMAKKTGAAVTVEEHQITGGLGGAVAEVLSRNHPVPMEFIGLQDTFGESGNPDELMEKYGMGAEDIIKAVKKVIKRK